MITNPISNDVVITRDYHVIYADPPWPYEFGFEQSGGADYQYPILEVDDLSRLKIGQNFAHPNACLMLWSTMPKLDLALWVMEEWGFDFITVAFVWVKSNPNADYIYAPITTKLRAEETEEGIWCGQGYCTNSNAELVLLGKRITNGPRGGKKLARLNRLDSCVRQIVFAPRGAHSAKPEEVRRRIDRLYGGRKIELFARQHADGWHSTGWDLDQRDIRKLIQERKQHRARIPAEQQQKP